MSTETIDLTAIILIKIKDLPLEQQQEILDFTEFITYKHNKNLAEKTKSQKKRIAGLYKGKGWMSDDFNEPLPPEVLGGII
ncbi:DUF2281 domain-containing protein [Geminocystis sp. GBBB08]|uniref:type II toxin-antitoxin system VapB family antitoxin n=1 Tax=Geminocystis sp. GBBB08 TaxID=2604140 RepID=UPI0027E2B649|nr:DUF2281 domain-containing protein [Geminocystis sp. GBBB08]MBL1208725.1 DUF2281 domain-containing protein [Geminocystis sp. GBBB08]